MTITQKTIAFRDSSFAPDGTETGAITGENILWKLDRPASAHRSKPSVSEIRSWSDKTARSVTYETFALKYRRQIKFKTGSGAYILGSINSFSPITSLGGLYPYFDSTDAQTQVTISEKNRLRGKVLSESVNLGQMLAEYRQTASLFTSLVPDAVRLTKALVKKQPALLFGNKKIGAVSDHFLKYQYGMKPLVSDVHGSLAALRRRFVENIYYETSVPIHRQSTSPWFTVGTLPYPNNLYLNNLFYKVFIQRDGHLYGRVKLDNALLFNSMGTFGLTNPAALAWELAPWSFAVDWLFNVGKVLSSLDSCLYCQDFFIYDAIHATSRIDFLYKADTNEYQPFDVDLGHRLHSSYIRTGPVMDTVIQQLQYKPHISATKVAIGTALLGQLISRR